VPGAVRNMVIYYIRLENIKRAQSLLNEFGDSSWKSEIQLRIDILTAQESQILAEESSESKFFQILKPVESEPTFTKITAACLFDRFSFDCFSREINLVPISKDDWRLVLSRSDIQFFFAESIWSGHDGGWKFAMSAFDTAAGDVLKEVLKECKKNKIKTVFWNKEDPVNYDAFIDVAKQFDIIFTSDVDSIPDYIRDCGHENIFPLPFAAQPIIHNPIRNKLPEHEVCFAGSWYIREHGNRKRDTKMLVDIAAEHGLHIFDRFHGTLNRNRFPAEYDDYVKGSLSYQEVCMAYRAYKVFLNVNSVFDSPTMFSRRVFEILASSTVVLSSPSIGMEEMLGTFVKSVENANEAKLELSSLLNNDIMRRELAHLGYREVMKNHTYSHRIRYIMSKLEIDTPPFETIFISCICVSNRPSLIDHIIKQFDEQNHETKELILMIEAADEEFESIKEKVNLRPDVKLKRVFSDEILGAIFNKGVDFSSGNYISKWDDDDLYGPSYLSDSIIPFKYSSASIVGKMEIFMYHEKTDSLYQKYPGQRHKYLQFIHGPTIIAKREVFEKVRFPEKSVGEDSGFLKNALNAGFKIYSGDPYNFVYMRSSDTKKHTYRPEDDVLLKNTKLISEGLSTEGVFI
jgi:spore maturation protein CgeB